MQKVVHIQDIGLVTIKKHKSARYVKLRVVPNKGLIVTIPAYCPYAEAYHAIEKRRGWIIKNLSAMQKIEEQTKYTLSHFPYKTFRHTIHVVIEAILDYEIKRKGDQIYVAIPFTIPFESEGNQLYFKELFEKLYRKEAKEHLPARTRYFADIYNLECNRITVKNQKSRWGSCSSTNNINLNLNLMKLPEHLRDYVILHELAHTIEKNHGAGFWKLLDTFTNGNAKTLDKELNQFNWAIP